MLSELVKQKKPLETFLLRTPYLVMKMYISFNSLPESFDLPEK